MSDLDPKPWACEFCGEHHARDNGDCDFIPRPEFEQDESKYPHMQGVADTTESETKS